MRIVLVGEMNPYGADPYYTLYPAPDGCAGQRLCCKILGMRRRQYLGSFERVNLCTGRWSLPLAREAAQTLWQTPGKFILLGSKVAVAFQVPFVPLAVSAGGTILVLPHPSGLSRLWNQPGMIGRARAAVATFVPELAALLGTTDNGLD